MSNSFLQLFKGPDNKVKELTLEDGRLSFATDTKKIYLDCDFTDSEGKVLQDRLAFGGSSGIFYGNREFSPDESTFVFGLDDLDNAEEIPQRDDLILNSDGCFYRIIAIIEAHEDDDGTYIPLQINADKLTVAGSGGGGGGGASGGLVAKKVDGQKRYFSAADGAIPIQYCVLSRETAASVDMQIVIRGNNVATVYSVPQSLDEPASVDLMPYVNYFNINAATDIVLRFTDSYGNTKNITYNSYFTYIDMHINVTSAQLGTKTSPNIVVPLYLFSPSYTAMAERYVCYRLTRPDSAVPDEAEISEKTVANGNAYNLNLALGQYASEGTYQLDVWLKGKMSATDTEYLYSEEKHLTFVYTSPDSTTPYISVEWESQNYVARKTGVLTYLVAYHLTESSTVTINIYRNGSETPYYSRQEQVTHGTPVTFSYKFPEEGTYSAKVVWNNNETVFGQTTVSTQVAPASNVTIPETYMSGLQVNLSAQGRSNNEVDRNKWISNVNNIETNCTLSNFNWSTNGWLTDENGDGYLHMTNGASLVVNFPIYSTQYTTGNKDPMRNGKAIEIDFRLSNVRDTNAIIMRAASYKDNGTINNGIICQGDKICINTSGKRNYYSPQEELTISDTERAATAGLRAYLTEDRRIHIAFDIEGSDTTGTYEGNRIKPMIYTFVDGVISGLVQVELNDSIADINPEVPSYFTISSDNADVDIYNIRIYEGFLTEQVIRNNFIADYADDTIQEALSEANDVLNSNNEIDFDKVKDAANIAYLVIEDMGSTGDKKGKGGWDQSDGISHLPYTKKDFRYVRSYYVDPFDPTPDGAYLIGSAENPVDAVIYCQGTSSLAYPVKNLRYRLVDTKYRMKYSPDDGATYANFPKVRLFTFKADYMESALAHNTGTGNVLQLLYDTPNVKLKTPAQEYFTDRTIVNNIVGVPCLIFFKKYTDDPGAKPEFIGRYNFNLDKGEPDLFGFTSVVDEEKGNFGVLTEQMWQNNKVVYNGALKPGYTAVIAKDASGFKPDTIDYYYRPFTNVPQTVASRENFSGISTPLGYKALLEIYNIALEGSRNSGLFTEYSPELTALIEAALEGQTVSDNDLAEQGYNRTNFETVKNNYVKQQTLAQYDIDRNNVAAAVTSLEVALGNFSIGNMQLLSQHDDENNKKTAELLFAQLSYGPIYTRDTGIGTIQCYEFLNNSYDLCGFRTSWDEMEDYNTLDNDGNPYSNWREAFESRYPEYEHADVDCDKRAFAEFVNWVASTDQSKVRNLYDQVPLATPYVGSDNTIYEYDTPEYRLAKFKKEAADHMLLDFVAFYYVVTEVILAIDSRAKNMMMCCFDANNDAGTGHWFPIFYDMDTALGVNNIGTLKFQYYAEDTDTQVMNANASYYTENGAVEVNYSTLWCNFRMAFQDRIKDMYIKLHKGALNYNGLVAWYNTKQADVFQMVHINKDHEYKYIKPITTPTPILENGVMIPKTYNGTNAAQGTRSLHRDYWLNHRFTFLTSKYPDMSDTTAADIYYRAFAAGSSSVAADMKYMFQTSSVQYANYSYSKTAFAPVVKVRPGEIVEGPPIANLNANEQECYLFNLGNIFDIGDMSTKYPSQFTVYRPIKLTKLKLGNSTPGYKNENLDNNSVVTSLGNLPLLRYLDVTNTALKGQISLESNQYINEVYAKGSGVTSFSFAKGGSLQKLTLPAGYDTLILLYNTFSTLGDKSAANEDDKALQFTEIRDLRYLGVESCPNFDTKELLKESIRAKRNDMTYTQNNQIYHTTLDAGLETTNLYDKLFTAFRLPDVNWTLDDNDPEEVTLNNGYVSDIPIVKYLSYCRQGYENDYTTRVVKQKANNQYFGGTIIIDNVHHPVDEFSISAAYSQMFPNLKISWTHSEGNLHGYHLNFNDDNGFQITEDTTNEELTNSIVYGIADLNTLNLSEYIANHVSIPKDLYTTNGQYTLVFRGWTLDGAKHSNDEIELNRWLDEGIKVEYDSEGHVTNIVNNIKDHLAASDFTGEDQVYNLYPIREDVIRYYDVTFHRYKEGSQQAISDPEHDIIPVNIGTAANPNYVNTLSVMWGTKAIMPDDEPTNMVLNDDGTTTVYPFDRYTYDAANVPIKAMLDNYPIFKEDPQDALDAKDAPSPASLFDVSAVDNVPNNIGSGLNNGVCLTLKTGILAPAVTVPAVYNGSPVYQFKLPRDVVMEKLKRIYFQNGENNTHHPIKILSTNVDSHTSVRENRILEYIDLTNTDVTMISACTFAYTPNLKLINRYLPDSIKLIEQYAFAQRTALGSSIDFAVLPYSLVEIGSYAFQNCASLTAIDLGHATLLQSINSHAFDGCTNLHGTPDINESDCLNQVRIVGDYAFYHCESLSLYTIHTYENYQSNLNYIGKHAFDGCSNLGWIAELRYVLTIDDYAFANCGNIGIAQMPNTLTTVGARIFEGDSLGRITGAMFYTDNKQFEAWTQTADGLDVVNHGMHPDAFGGLAAGFKFQYFYILYGGAPQGNPPEILDATVAPWNGYMDTNGNPLYYRYLDNGVYKYYAADAEDLPASGIEPCTRWGATGHFTDDNYWIAFGQ